VNKTAVNSNQVQDGSRNHVMIALLSVTLIGAMRWAFNVTQANAKQMSGNALRWQEQLDAQAKK
jgi:hypothetical protein